MRQAGLTAAVLGLLAALPAAAEPPPLMGRYMPLFPGMYFNGGYARDPRDRLFSASGEELETTVPSIGGQTEFPEKRLEASWLWHFPMFETYRVPFFSSRTHLARASFSYADTKTLGALADFNASERGAQNDRDQDQADDLRDRDSGIGDLLLEFGSYLYGSSDGEWRTRERTPLAVLLLTGFNIPYGEYDRDSAVSPGSNTGAFHYKLALHAQPWRGGFIDAAYGGRAYLKNQDPAYGALAPAYQGDDRLWDISLGQRLWRRLYATAFATGREGEPNGYLNPRFAPNAPTPPTTVPASDNYPAPGVYYDAGTELRTVGGALSVFLDPHWRMSVHYTRPVSGRSGEFTLPFNNRQPAGCTPGALSCSVTEGESVLVDGLGPARVFASDWWMLSFTYNYGQGDSFVCTGCKR